MTFSGPRGITFPQNFKSAVGYCKIQTLESLKNNEANVSSQRDERNTHIDISIHECEFTEEEIRRGFDFIDLDKNGYVGAAELRHVLICMGELVTDEEIDMMIGMLDFSGDGQVNFDEFRKLVQNTDANGVDQIQEASAPLKRSDANEIVRNKDIERRNLKRQVLSRFVLTNKIMKEDIDYLKRFLIDRYEKENLRIHNADNEWEIGFETFCEVLSVEATGESKSVFHLFDDNGSKNIDMRLLILSLSNYISDFTTEERCRYIFNIFDKNRTGKLNLVDIETIMMGNHLQGRRAIARKAQTVLKFADIDGSGAISLPNLIIAATKFPNLIFPSHFRSQNDD